MFRRSAIAGAVAVSLLAAPVAAQTVPKEMSWTAYDTGWKGFTANAPSDEEAFAEGWLEARAAALRKAGMDVVFD